MVNEHEKLLTLLHKTNQPTNPVNENNKAAPSTCQAKTFSRLLTPSIDEGTGEMAQIGSGFPNASRAVLIQVLNVHPRDPAIPLLGIYF